MRAAMHMGKLVDKMQESVLSLFQSRDGTGVRVLDRAPVPAEPSLQSSGFFFFHLYQNLFFLF